MQLHFYFHSTVKVTFIYSLLQDLIPNTTLLIVKKNLQGMTPMDYALHYKHIGINSFIYLIQVIKINLTYKIITRKLYSLFFLFERRNNCNGSTRYQVCLVFKVIYCHVELSDLINRGDELICMETKKYHSLTEGLIVNMPEVVTVSIN